MAAGKQPPNPILTWTMENIIFVLGMAVIAGAAITIWNMSMALIKHNSDEALREHGIEPISIVAENRPSRFGQLYSKVSLL